MSRISSRVGRRRRVLNEEVLSAGNAGRSLTSEADDFVPGDTPRYGAGANIENHPQVTDLVPRKFRTIALVVVLVVGAGVAAEMAAFHAAYLNELVPAVSAASIASVFADRTIAWISATLLLTAALYGRLIFSLRRHRVDDHRGRYRVWQIATWVAVALSINTVVGAHQIVADALGYFSGWSVLPAHAEWWLAPAAVLGGWLLARLTIDASECRSALVVYSLAIGCLVAAGVCNAGWSPTWANEVPGLLGRELPLAGNLLLLTGSLLFARYVVLDVQGLVEHGVPSIERAASHPSSQPEPVAAEIKPEVSSWVDGSNHPDTSENGRRRLSKAERKRLRKQKRQQAA